MIHKRFVRGGGGLRAAGGNDLFSSALSSLETARAEICYLFVMFQCSKALGKKKVYELLAAEDRLKFGQFQLL